jgi:hypothetical protein
MHPDLGCDSRATFNRSGHGHDEGDDDDDDQGDDHDGDDLRGSQATASSRR